MFHKSDPYSKMLVQEIEGFGERPYDDPLRFLCRVVVARDVAEHSAPRRYAEKIAKLSGLRDRILAGLEVVDGGGDIAAAFLSALDAGSSDDIEATLQRVVATLAGSEDVAARAAIQAICSVERQYRNDIYAGIAQKDSVASDEKGAQHRSLAETGDILGKFLRRACADEASLHVSAVTRVVGGFSKETLIVTLQGNHSLPDQLVVRHELQTQVSNSPVTLRGEWEIIKTLHAAGLPVPALFAFEETGTVLDGPFIVMEKVPGSNVGDGFDFYGTSPQELGIDLARAIARLHQVPVETVDTSLAGRDVPVAEHMASEIDQFEREWRALNQPNALLEASFSWLRANLKHLSERRSLVHGDLGFHNILVDDGRLTALLDWEKTSVGHPAQDIGYLWHAAIQLCDWETFIQAYRDAGAALPSAREIAFFSLWASVWRTMLTLRVQAMFERGDLGGLSWGYISAYLAPKEFQMLGLKLDGVLSGE